MIKKALRLTNPRIIPMKLAIGKAALSSIILRSISEIIPSRFISLCIAKFRASYNDNVVTYNLKSTNSGT